MNYFKDIKEDNSVCNLSYQNGYCNMSIFENEVKDGVQYEYWRN